MLVTWNQKYDGLAIYNGEINRGVKHTAKYTKEMGQVQSEYDNDILEHALKNNITILK